MAKVFLAAVGLTPTLLYAADAPGPEWLEEQTRGAVELLAPVYTNTNYGFEVAVPAGTHALVNAPPSPNDGVKIILGYHCTISVFASFNVGLYGSSAALLKASLQSGHAAGIVQTVTLLGGKAALRARFLADAGQEDVVARVSGRSPDDAIDFNAVLNTDRSGDEAVFSKLLASFRFVKRAG